MSEIFKLYQYKYRNKVICSIMFHDLGACYNVINKGGFWSLARVEDAIAVAEKHCQNEGYPDFKVVYKGIYEDPSGMMKFKPSSAREPNHWPISKINEHYQEHIDYVKEIAPKHGTEIYDKYNGMWSVESKVYHPYIIDSLNERAVKISFYLGLDIKPVPYDYDGWVDRTHVIEERYGL